VSGATLNQAEMFKHLVVVFTIDGRQDENWTSGLAKLVQYYELCNNYLIILKRELLKKAKFSVFKTIFFPRS